MPSRATPSPLQSTIRPTGRAVACRAAGAQADGHGPVAACGGTVLTWQGPRGR